MIAVVDYGMGNLKSVTNAFQALGADIVVTREKATIEASAAMVLPGVGAFGRCIEILKLFGLIDVVRQWITEDRLYLGICLGMQILFESSEETAGTEGLGMMKGTVPRFTGNLKVPHMGWNSIDFAEDSKLFRGIRNHEFFYFVHSYYCLPTEAVTAATTTYGIEFASSVRKGNIYACQFHPEKSQRVGLKVLQNFIDLAAR